MSMTDCCMCRDSWMMEDTILAGLKTAYLFYVFIESYLKINNEMQNTTVPRYCIYK